MQKIKQGQEKETKRTLGLKSRVYVKNTCLIHTDTLSEWTLAGPGPAMVCPLIPESLFAMGRWRNSKNKKDKNMTAFSL